MNKIVNKFFLGGHKFVPEMHLRQPRFTYSACGGDSRYIYQNKLGKACFHHDMTYENFKGLPRGTYYV